MVESETEDPEVAFLKSLSKSQKKKLLKYVYCYVIHCVNSVLCVSNEAAEMWCI